MSEVAAKVLSMSLRPVCERIFRHRARFRSKEEEEEEEKEKEGRKKQGKDRAGKRQIFASSSSPAGCRQGSGRLAFPWGMRMKEKCSRAKGA